MRPLERAAPELGRASFVRAMRDPRYACCSVDKSKTVTFHIVSASFSNWEGESQRRTIDKLTADEFVDTNPNVAGGRGSAGNFYKRAKWGGGIRELLRLPPAAGGYRR